MEVDGEEATPQTHTIQARFVSDVGVEAGPPLDLPVNVTKQQLELILNALLKNEDQTPYLFFINDDEVRDSIQQTLGAKQLDVENVLDIVYQPQAVFRVRPVTRCTSSMPGHAEAIVSLSFSPNSLHLASGSGDTTLRLWDLTTETPHFTCTGHRNWVLSVAWSPDSLKVASADKAGEIRVWCPETGKLLGRPLVGHKKWVSCLSWEPYHKNPECRYLASAGNDNDVRIWDVVLGTCTKTIAGHTAPVTAVRWGGSGLLYTSSRDRSIKMWRAEDGVLCKTFTGHAHWVNNLALNTDYVLRTGPFHPVMDRSKSYAVSDKTEMQKSALERFEKVCPDGVESFVSCSDDFTLYLWKSSQKQFITRMTGHQNVVNDVKYSPDVKLIASASFDKSVRLWRAGDGAFICAFRGHVQAVYTVAWSADSRLILSGSKDSTLKVWSVKERKLAQELPGHADEVFGVDWAPDGSRVASGGKDKVLKLQKSPDVQKKTPVIFKRSRCTQVMPEDIDLALMKESDRVEMFSKGSPIELPSGEEMIPQCRICLRRVARENLEIILAQHKKKARVVFQIRVFPHDAYPFICINCQNMLDMFFEFKNAMIKAKNLLMCKRAHMESNGWDDQETVELFKKCQQVVANHRQQIDSLYEEQTKPHKTECEEYLEDNDSDAGHNDNNDDDDDGDVNETMPEPVIKPECVVNETEGGSAAIEDTVTVEVAPHEVVETNLSHPKQESDESEPDDSMDEDYKVDDDYDPVEEYEEHKFKYPKKGKVKKEKKEKREKKEKKEPKNKQPPTVMRQLCDFCGESIRPESVESHRNKHLGIKPYICSVEKCEVAFSSRYNLSKHIKKFHKPGGVGAHPCNICGKVIQGSIGVLKYHQKRHNIDQKSYICQICGKGFTMKWYLTQHSIIHTGEFPHKCKYCGKRFNNKWSMKTHEKNIHEKKNQMVVQTEPQELQTWNPALMNSIPLPIPLTHPQTIPPVGPQNVYALIPDENSGQ